MQDAGVEPTGIREVEKYGLRNGSLLSVAPTGTISLFAGTFTGGVEPMFKIAYERTTHSTEDSGKTFLVYARGVRDLLAHHGISDQTPVKEIKKKFDFLVESHDIDPLERIKMQSVMQRYIDNSISSTINLPNSATSEQIFDIYMNAWKYGLKGVTVFRDGCLRGNILGVEKKKKDTDTPDYNTILPAKRRGVDKVDGSTYKQSSSCANSMYVTVNKTGDGDIFEVFTNSSGGCQSNISTITRLVSLALRSGIKVDKIVEELRETKCPACQALRRDGRKGISLSCSNAIADAIEKKLKDTDKVDEHIEDDGYLVCPECGKKTMHSDSGCFSCSNCAFSKCE